MTVKVRRKLIREVVCRTCGCAVHDRDRLVGDLKVDNATAVELLVALELALRTELHSMALTPELTVRDLVGILSRTHIAAMGA